MRVTGRGTAVAASAAGVTVLAGLVALASRRSSPWGAPAVHWPSVGGGRAIAAAIVLLLALGLIVGLIRALLGMTRVRLEVSRPGRWSWLATALTVLLLALVLVSIGHRGAQRSLLPQHRSGGPPPEPQARPTHRSGPGLDTWLVAGIGGALAVALVAAGLVARTRRAPPDDGLEPPTPPPAAMEEAGQVDLDALLADPDPRRAVIAAYAGMERTLARVGVGRRPPEAPLEYLGRLRAAGPALAPMAGRLTALYQRARYGAGPISPAMRDDAIAALRALGEAAGA